MEKNENVVSHNFTLDSFAKAKDRMIATNEKGSIFDERVKNRLRMLGM